MIAEDYAPIILETRIAYRRPITIHDRPRGRIWLTRLERLRWSIGAEFAGAATSHASAEQTGVFIRLSTGRPIPVPAFLHDALAANA
jgi:acyl-CoA thioester hydrolase